MSSSWAQNLEELVSEQIVSFPLESATKREVLVMFALKYRKIDMPESFNDLSHRNWEKMQVLTQSGKVFLSAALHRCRSSVQGNSVSMWPLASTVPQLLVSIFSYSLK